MSLSDLIRKRGADDARRHWERAMASLHQAGFPDSQMQLDTGHKMWVYHQGHEDRDPGFKAVVWHPGHGEEGYDQGAVYGHLGTDPDQVGPLLRNMFGRRDVLNHMRTQMTETGWGPHLNVDMRR